MHSVHPPLRPSQQFEATPRGEIQAAHGQQHIVSGASDGSKQGTNEAGASNDAAKQGGCCFATDVKPGWMNYDLWGWRPNSDKILLQYDT